MVTTQLGLVCLDRTPSPKCSDSNLIKALCVRVESVCACCFSSAFVLSAESVSYMYRKDTPWNDPPILATTGVRSHTQAHRHTDTPPESQTHTH